MIFNLRVKGSVLGQFVSNWQAHRHKNATKLWIWPRMKKKQNNRSREGGEEYREREKSRDRLVTEQDNDRY